MVDFWATWCGPCQRPMKHNCEVLEKKGDEWKDKVRIVAVSINETPKKVKDYNMNRGFDAVEHFVAGESDCGDVYGVTGVPHVCLVDKKGKIQFLGHPFEMKLEEDIQALLDDKDLSYKVPEESKSAELATIEPEKAQAEGEKVLS